jgi:tight adherence protein C
MMDTLDQMFATTGGTGLALGVMAVLLAVFVAAVWGMVGRGVEVGRYGPSEDERRGPESLRTSAPTDEDGLDRYLLPQEKSERWQVRRLLHRAGFDGPAALRNFYLVRIGLAAVALVVGFLVTTLMLPASGGSGLFGGPVTTTFVVVIGAMALGFYLPLLLIRWRAAARQTMIRRSFPDALDLLQVMIQAGLGLDAAMQRVGNEMGRSCPPLADEINLLVLELRAGKTREQALQDFSNRIDLDYVRAFTTVLAQSLRFGTSVSDALGVFSDDMRNARMMAAEEKANKLPVQMSVVLVLFMLPAVMAVALGPVIIRAIRVIMPSLG